MEERGDYKLLGCSLRFLLNGFSASIQVKHMIAFRFLGLKFHSQASPEISAEITHSDTFITDKAIFTAE